MCGGGQGVRKKNLVRVGPPLTKLSGYVHANVLKFTKLMNTTDTNNLKRLCKFIQTTMRTVTGN